MIRLPPTYPLLVSFLHLLLFVSTVHAHSKILCIDKEKHALLDFKLSFVEDPGGFLSDWRLDNTDCCAWFGVECDVHTGHVISLSLSFYTLKSYRLRPSLLELQHLTSLDFSYNRFPMKIPKFIASLTNLTSLDLAHSQFFGEIPPQLGNLSELQALDLSNSNGLYSHNLHWLSRLSSLTNLDLSDANLSNAIDWASFLHMLPILIEFNCRSCSLPPPPLSSISHITLTSLQALDLSNNSVSSSTFSYLVKGTNNLQSLSLDYMKLENSNIHQFLGAVINGKSRYLLQDLSLASNNLNIMPVEVTMFPSLMSLDLSFNRISGSLAEILQSLPSNLTSLDVSSNLLNGTVISEKHFSKFFQLESLQLSDNNLLTFNFSKSWVPPFQLQTLHLGSCKVGPSFPDWILTQQSLESLDISNSMISGAIPDSFWEISTGLYLFNLSHNKINCKIPNLPFSPFSFKDATRDLSYNSFHGAIPLFLFNAMDLDLSNNSFTSFPPLQPNISSLDLNIINLSGNRLSGSLPNWLFQITSLWALNLANNKLSGTLPAEIGSQQELSVLHLSNNNFSGELPLSMQNCTQLIILEVANNKFTGAVPFWLGESMTLLVALSLRSNNFVGELPSSLCHLQSLQALDVSDNQISGFIPGCLHNITTMSTNIRLNIANEVGGHISALYEGGYLLFLDYASITWKGAPSVFYSPNLDQRNVINLSGNLLRGEIPAEVTALKMLRSLDLSRNALHGSIPEKIGQMTSLEVLLLSFNRLSGEIPESLASLTFLDKLNLSNNNLSGRIPTSTQLQSFSASSYAGNPKLLCGEPLPTMCPGDEDDNKKLPPSSRNARDEGDESFDIQVFLAALGMGFAVTFLGVLGMLHFNRPWRLAFFKLSENIADRIFVATSLFPSRIKRRLCFRRQMELQICE